MEQMRKVMESDETKIAVLVEKVGTMSVVLTKLDTKLDVMTEKFAAKEQVVALEGRVSNLEGWKNKMLGALVVAQVVWGAVVYFLTGHKP